MENRIKRAQSELQDDPRLEKLVATLHRFSPIRAAGITRDEVRHSRLLAAVLDPTTRVYGRELLVSLMKTVAQDLEGKHPHVARKLLQVCEPVSTAQWHRVRVRREYHNIDIVIDIVIDVEDKSRRKSQVVVAIENKIDAGEREFQLRDYQETLQARFLGGSVRPDFLDPKWS